MTIDHQHGSTTIESPPERIVDLGGVETDALLALGVPPVAVGADQFTMDRAPGGIWPWQEGKYGGSTPEVISPEWNAIEFETIAALQPDLIVAQYAGIDATEYEKLSKIAPTLAKPRGYGNYQVPWQEMTSRIGLALGQPDLAEQVIADLEATFGEHRETHPEFEGATAVYAGVIDTGEYYVEAGNSTRVEILRLLGLELPDEISDLAGEEFFVSVSRERIGLFDHDVVVWELGSPNLRALIEEDTLYRQLGVHQEGRAVYVEDPILAGALVQGSILSIPYVLDELVPRLAAAVDGDPSTSTD